MKKILFCCIAIVLTITSCQNIETETLGTNHDRPLLKINGTGEAEPLLGLTDLLELGNMHNAVSMYALVKYNDLLDSLSNTVEAGETIYVDRGLLDDYLLYHIMDYVNCTYADFDYNLYKMHQANLQDQYLNLDMEDIPEVWQSLSEELDDCPIAMEEGYNRLQNVYEEYMIDGELDENECSSLVAMTVAIHSAWLWDNTQSVIETNFVIDNSARCRRWWRADVRGAIAGFILGGGNVSVSSGLIGAVIGAAIASIIAAILDCHIFVKATNNIEYPISFVNNSDFVEEYDLFSLDTSNPYLFPNE